MCARLPEKEKSATNVASQRGGSGGADDGRLASMSTMVLTTVMKRTGDATRITTHPDSSRESEDDERRNVLPVESRSRKEIENVNDESASWNENENGHGNGTAIMGSDGVDGVDAFYSFNRFNNIHFLFDFIFTMMRKVKSACCLPSASACARACDCKFSYTRTYIYI